MTCCLRVSQTFSGFACLNKPLSKNINWKYLHLCTWGVRMHLTPECTQTYGVILRQLSAKPSTGHYCLFSIFLGHLWDITYTYLMCKITQNQNTTILLCVPNKADCCIHEGFGTVLVLALVYGRVGYGQTVGWIPQDGNQASQASA